MEVALLLVLCVLAITTVVVDGAVVAGVSTGQGTCEECLLRCTHTATQQIIGTTTKMQKTAEPIVTPAMSPAAEEKERNTSISHMYT